MTVADRIRNKRIELGFSQTELAERAHYSDKTAISKIEHSGNNVTMKQLRRIAAALNVTTQYLLGWDEPTVDEKGNPEIISHQVILSDEEVAKVLELYQMIERLPEDKRDALLKYLQFLQSEL